MKAGFLRKDRLLLLINTKLSHIKNFRYICVLKYEVLNDGTISYFQ